MYANVLPLSKTAKRTTAFGSRLFTYRIPGGVNVEPGQLVEVPLGSRAVRGVVKTLTKTTSVPVKKLKELSPIETVNWFRLSERQWELAEWIAEEWICPLGTVLELMIPPHMKRPAKASESAAPVAEPVELPELTSEQVAALASIESAKTPTLLWGVTGSGKTEVYFRRLQALFEEDASAQALVLVPEIGLVPQMEQRLRERFPQKELVIVHSKRSRGEREYAFRQSANGEAHIILGTRSALFVPFSNLQLLVADECHDTSYTSWDKAPRYDGMRVAERLTRQWNAECLFGSATPPLALVHRAQKGEINVASLKERVFKQPLPEVRIVDKRNEQARHGGEHASVLSWELQEAIQETLEAEQQVMLFLNRRGAATSVLCTACGWVASCPTCELPFTHHVRTSQTAQKNTLVCHHCNAQEKVPVTCPECSEQQTLRFLGAGTERIELILAELFPDANIERIDADTTTQKGVHEQLLKRLQDREIDIVIGTQMITKGLDIPTVGLVGIVQADALLQLPDVQSHERTFQLLTQVVGRTGRRNDMGRVLLQTYEPDSRVIQAVAQHDMARFYAEELQQRKQWSYPPFALLVRILVEEQQAEKAVQRANDLSAQLQKTLVPKGITVLGPAPAFRPRLRGKTRIQLVLKIPYDQKSASWDVLKKMARDARVDISPPSLL